MRDISCWRRSGWHTGLITQTGSGFGTEISSELDHVTLWKILDQ